jgi:hypothetical protein
VQHRVSCVIRQNPISKGANPFFPLPDSSSTLDSPLPVYKYTWTKFRCIRIKRKL